MIMINEYQHFLCIFISLQVMTSTLGSDSIADFINPNKKDQKVVTEEEIFAEILRHEDM